MNIPLFENRLTYILGLIDQFGQVKVTDLARDLAVSEMTIRRDLAELESRNLVRRIHGGAVSRLGRSYEPPLLMRSSTSISAKKAIGKFAAGLVKEGDSIAIDVGSTTLEMANYLRGGRNLTVVTPSILVANVLIAEPDMQIIVTGGILRKGEGSLIGELPEIAFRNYYVDKLFLGVGAISPEDGLTEYSWDDAIVKKAMIKSAKQVYVLADSTKFNKTAFISITSFEKFHHLITDKVPPENLQDALDRADVVVSVVEAD